MSRLHHGKTGYLAQSSIPLYFGLGTAAASDQVEILWPSGRKQTVTTGIPKNGLLVVKEPEPE